MKNPADKLLKKNPQLTHSEMMKVTSHVQREDGEWIINTLMIENVDVPFKYKRKKPYKSLVGARGQPDLLPGDRKCCGS